MNFTKIPAVLLLSCLLFLIFPFRAQSQDDDSTAVPVGGDNGKGFHLGLVIGTYIANKSTTSLYDGYGFDVNGQRNTFPNSFLYNQIVNYYGGGYGGVDYIAQALNVNHNEWSFNEGDMPINMHYTVAFQVGFNSRYNLSKKRAIIFNVNGTKLTVNGNFSISTSIINNGIQGVPVVHPYTITGSEQRLIFQLGYQKIFGDDEDLLNFFVEGGFNLTLAKVTKNQAYINGNGGNIQIDLMGIYNQPAFNYYKAKYYTGVGPGVFGGIGLNLDFNPKYKLQLLYSPSYDVIRLGYQPQFRLQHSIGLRAYYNF
jgi:hypothetical protein